MDEVVDKLCKMESLHSNEWTKEDLESFAFAVDRLSELKCILCGGKGHIFKKCTTLTTINQVLGDDHVRKFLMTEILFRLRKS